MISHVCCRVLSNESSTELWRGSVLTAIAHTRGAVSTHPARNRSSGIPASGTCVMCILYSHASLTFTTRIVLVYRLTIVGQLSTAAVRRYHIYNVDRFPSLPSQLIRFPRFWCGGSWRHVRHERRPSPPPARAAPLPSHPPVNRTSRRMRGRRDGSNRWGQVIKLDSLEA